MSFRLTILAFIIFSTSFLSSCGGNTTTMLNSVESANKSLEKDGSPYRWSVISASGSDIAMEKKLIGVVAPTSADPSLQKDILIAIEKSEITSGGQSNPNLLETRSVSASKNKISEIWVIGRDGDKQFAYTVDMLPTAEGGTDYYITGPW